MNTFFFSVIFTKGKDGQCMNPQHFGKVCRHRWRISRLWVMVYYSLGLGDMTRNFYHDIFGHFHENDIHRDIYHAMKTMFRIKRPRSTCRLAPGGTHERLCTQKGRNIVGLIFIKLILRFMRHHSDASLVYSWGAENTAASCSFQEEG